MADRFKTHVLDPLQRQTGHKFQAPRREGITWDYDEGPEHREVQLSVRAEDLCGNLRSDAPASPVWALCLAAALDGTEGAPVRAAVQIVGDLPAKPGLGYKTSKQLLQFRRSALLLQTLVELLPERFVLTIPDDGRWAWPEWTWFGIERYRKNKGRPDGGVARLAAEIELSPSLFTAFGESMEPIRRFQSHFPLVVHSGEVTKESNWTPGGTTGVDLWVASADHRRVHLFELAAGKRCPVGSLAELLCNAAVIDHVADGNGHFHNDAVGLSAVRRARRMSFWLSAEAYHPLVFDEQGGDSAVLRWLNRPLRARNLQIGVLPWEGDVANPRFRFDARWGGGLS